MKFILVILYLTNGHAEEIKRMPNEFTKQECVLYGNLLKSMANDNRMIFRCVRK